MKKIVGFALSFSALAVAFAPSPARAQAEVGFNCVVKEIREWGDRLDVACSNSIPLGTNTVQFLAISKSDVARANRWVTMATSAMLSGKSFFVSLVPSGSNNIVNCPASDCRTPTIFGIR